MTMYDHWFCPISLHPEHLPMMTAVTNCTKDIEICLIESYHYYVYILTEHDSEGAQAIIEYCSCKNVVQLNIVCM